MSSLSPVLPALRGLHRNRLAVGAVVIGVALGLDAADPVPGRRGSLIGLGVTLMVLALVFEALAPRVVHLQNLILGELLADAAASAWVVALTGGAAGQFVILFPLVAFVGGTLLGVGGGMALGFVTAAAYEVLVLFPGVGTEGGPAGDGSPAGLTAQAVFYPVFFIAVGGLSGLLGRRMAESERALARAAMEVEKLKLDTESIIQNLSSGLLTIDRSGRIVHFNRVAETLLGQKAQEVRGKKIGFALGEPARELVDKIRATLDEGIPLLRAEVRFHGVPGEPVPLGVSTSILKDGNDEKTGVVALFQDLTEVRRLEQASRRQDRLSAIGSMAASIAHEVRNCVNPISGSIELLQQELDLKGENARLLDLAGSEAARMERFVSELLNFSRGNPVHPGEVDVSDLLDRTLARVRSHPAYRPSVALRKQCGEAPVVVSADQGQMEQVFFNLALNALEAMGPVGCLTIGVEAGETGDVRIEFADTGVGMSRETLDRVFEPFYSTKESGTGLGLAIAHRIVERHRGRMEVTSHPGSGTRVKVCLPGTGAATAGKGHLACAA